jgi:hypothetical protein
MRHYLLGTAPSPAFAKSYCGHLELAAMAAGARARTVVLTHITEQFDQRGLRERTFSEMVRILFGTIIFGEDGMSISVKSGPSKLD